MSPRRLSPSSLNQFLGCEHRTYLDALDARGVLGAERLAPNAQLLLERGERHEEAFLQRLRDEGRDTVSLPRTGSVSDRYAATVQEMRAGRQVIHQACLLDDGWVGYADFLIRVDEQSDLGNFSYEVHEAKLGSHPRPSHIFQSLFYNDRLAELQGWRPTRVHLVLGNDERPAFAPDEFDAYAARVRARFLQRRAELDGPQPAPAYPYPVADCEFCPWWKHCADRRRDEDHLSLVAGLQRSQGLKLEEEGVHTVVGVAGVPARQVVPRLHATTLDGLRAQADLQVRSRGLDVPLYELLKPAHDRGLARLPEPSDGDVFFDFEGDPFWGDDGLEYLFGTVSLEDGAWRYRRLWATSRADEKRQFETWMDWVSSRLSEHPDLHIFHYNSYEPTAIKKLMSRHATRAHEVDELLRRKVFVDLYGVVRQAMRVGIESYGLKPLEPVFGFSRDAELRGATGSLRRWQEFEQTREPRFLEEIAGYNEDDCRSTAALRNWLMERRGEAEAQFEIELGALLPEPEREPSDRAQRYRERVELARDLLMPGLPDDESEDDAEQRARRIAFDLVGYHEREAKPAWWAHFARVDSSIADLRDNDSEAIAGLEPATGSVREDAGASWRWQLQFPPQQYKLRVGGAWDPDADYGVTIESLDERTRTVTVRRSKKSGDAIPAVLLPGLPIATEAQIDALLRFADRVHEHGLMPCGDFDAATDLLLARAPRMAQGTAPLGLEAGYDDARLCAQVAGLERSALVVQGPPGSGKTYAGARLAVDLMQRHGMRVGVMATSHKAIVNFLETVDLWAAKKRYAFRGWKKASDDPDNNYKSDHITSSTKPPKDVELQLVAATSWWWARANEHESVDVLFIDEAGQVSLADAIAVSQGAKNTVLLGDPQQLAHVSQGTHLHGSGASVLQHLLLGENTIPRDRGVFLERSWRMHPRVCAFVSKTMYDGLLHSAEDCSRQTVTSPGLSGAGLRMLGVEHTDNRQTSPEEAAVIAEEIERLLDGGRYVDRDGDEHELTSAEILVVAPYNAQVRTLKAALPPGARVGTVDKFQGQQAPVVFFSMTSSSGEDVPRGMDFLFSRNRLNVAVSRAQALAVVVCSPRLLSTRCTTVEQMQLVNMLSRFADAAR